MSCTLVQIVSRRLNCHFCKSVCAAGSVTGASILSTLFCHQMSFSEGTIDGTTDQPQRISTCELLCSGPGCLPVRKSLSFFVIRGVQFLYCVAWGHGVEDKLCKVRSINLERALQAFVPAAFNRERPPGPPFNCFEKGMRMATTAVVNFDLFQEYEFHFRAHHYVDGPDECVYVWIEWYTVKGRDGNEVTYSSSCSGSSRVLPSTCKARARRPQQKSSGNDSKSRSGRSWPSRRARY